MGYLFRWDKLKQVEALIFPSLPPEVTKPDQTYSLQLRLDVSQIQTIHWFFFTFHTMNFASLSKLAKSLPTWLPDLATEIMCQLITILTCMFKTCSLTKGVTHLIQSLFTNLIICLTAFVGWSDVYRRTGRFYMLEVLSVFCFLSPIYCTFRKRDKALNEY